MTGCDGWCSISITFIEMNPRSGIRMIAMTVLSGSIFTMLITASWHSCADRARANCRVCRECDAAWCATIIDSACRRPGSIAKSSIPMLRRTEAVMLAISAECRASRTLDGPGTFHADSSATVGDGRLQIGAVRAAFGLIRFSIPQQLSMLGKSYEEYQIERFHPDRIAHRHHDYRGARQHRAARLHRRKGACRPNQGSVERQTNRARFASICDRQQRLVSGESACRGLLRCAGDATKYLKRCFLVAHSQHYLQSEGIFAISGSAYTPANPDNRLDAVVLRRGPIR